MIWNINPKFELGQTVFYGWASHTGKRKACDTCLGTGEWSASAPNGESIQVRCDECEDGRITVFADRPYVETRTIGCLRVNTSDEKPISYMCNETGVGSGTIYYEDQLHDTEEKAHAFAAIEVQEAIKNRAEVAAEFTRRQKRNKARRAKANSQ